MGDVIHDVELHPGEDLPLVANFEDILATGETVSTAVATAFEASGAAAPAGLFAGTLLVVTPRVQQRVTMGAGVALGEEYLVVITATTSAGLDYVQRFRITVVALIEPSPALIVGGAEANSYVSLEEALAYFDRRLGAGPWDQATRGDRARALIAAARDFESVRWKGQKADLRVDTSLIHTYPAVAETRWAQALAWPRTHQVDAGGAYTVPPEIKEAQCEQALFLLAAGQGAERRARLQAQGVQSFSVEGMSETFRQDGGQWMLLHPWGRLCPDAQRLVARHVEWGIEVGRG